MTTFRRTSIFECERTGVEFEAPDGPNALREVARGAYRTDMCGPLDKSDGRGLFEVFTAPRVPAGRVRVVWRAKGGARSLVFETTESLETVVSRLWAYTPIGLDTE